MAITAAAISAGGSILGGVLGGKGSKGSSQTNTTTQDTASYSQLNPHASALPLYAWYAQNANRLMGQPIPYFPGQGYVGPSGATQGGVGQLLQGSAAMVPFLERMGGTYDFLTGAADVANNPYVQGMLGANAQQVGQQLAEKWLPEISRGAQAVNQMGSSRLGLAQGEAIGRAGQALANANAQTMGQAYGQGVGAMGNALGQTGSVLQNLLAPGLGQIGAGQTVEDYQNRALQDQIARFNYMFTEPYQRMNAVQGWMQGLAPIGLQQGTSQMVGMAPNPNYQNPMQGALAGMQMGGAIGNQLANLYKTVGSSSAGTTPVAPNYGWSPAFPTQSQQQTFFDTGGWGGGYGTNNWGSSFGGTSIW